MKGLVGHLYAVLFHLGGFGALALGILDSSLLFFMPLANDLLVIGLTTQHHARLPYYAVMATAGSVLGCLFTDILSRKGGEAELGRHVPRRRLEYVKKKIRKNAAWALGFASLMPPPFPFTPFMAAAAALQYPRRKLLAVIAVTRFARFSLVGLLAVFFGEGIIQIGQSPPVQYGIGALVVISIAGSAFSIYSWVKRSRTANSRGSSGPHRLGRRPGKKLLTFPR